MSVKEDVKVAIIRSGKSMTDVINDLNEKHNRRDTLQNLSNKLRRGTLRYEEAVEIADVIGYEIIWVPRQQHDSK